MNPWIPIKDPVKIASLGKLLEELGELTQIVSRCIIQGEEEKDPNTNISNIIRLQQEIADVYATITDVKHQFNLDEDFIHNRYFYKQQHLQEWHNLIREKK